MTPRKRLVVHVAVFIAAPILVLSAFFVMPALSGGEKYPTADEAAAKACGVPESAIKYWVDASHGRIEGRMYAMDDDRTVTLDHIRDANDGADRGWDSVTNCD